MSNRFAICGHSDFVDGVWSGVVPVETTSKDLNIDWSMPVILAPVSTSPFTVMGAGTGSPAFCKASARGLLIPQRKSSNGPFGVIGSVRWGTAESNPG